jgi:hypothetical protein
MDRKINKPVSKSHTAFFIYPYLFPFFLPLFPLPFSSPEPLLFLQGDFHLVN